MILEWLSNSSWASIIAGLRLPRMNSLPDCARFTVPFDAVEPPLINSCALENLSRTGIDPRARETPHRVPGAKPACQAES